MSEEGVDKVEKGILLLEEAGAVDGEKPFGQALSRFGLVAKADLPPLDRRPDALFSSVIGGLDSLIFKEGKQVLPVFEQSATHASHISISGKFVRLETIAHTSSDRNRFEYKALPVQMVVSPCVEQSKHPADLAEHPSGESYGIRTPAGMADSFDIPDDMSPTDLSEPLVITRVGRKSVGTQYSCEGVSKDSPESFRSPGGSHGKECQFGTDKCP